MKKIWGINDRSKTFRSSSSIYLIGIILWIACCPTLNHASADTIEKETLAPPFKTTFSTSFALLQYDQSSVGESQGNYAGIYLNGIIHTNSIMLSLEAEHIFGNSIYEGTFYAFENYSLSQTEDIRSTTYERITELRFLSGLDFFSTNKLLTPFIGLGFYRWRVEYSGDGSYHKSTVYYYLPIGMQLTLPISQDSFCTISIEYDLIVSGNAKTYMSDAYEGANDPENEIKFGDSHGLRLSAVFKEKITRKYAFTVQPYVTYWRIQDLKSADATYGEQQFTFDEPDYSIAQYGVRFGFEF